MQLWDDVPDRKAAGMAPADAHWWVCVNAQKCLVFMKPETLQACAQYQSGVLERPDERTDGARAGSVARLNSQISYPCPQPRAVKLCPRAHEAAEHQRQQPRQLCLDGLFQKCFHLTRANGSTSIYRPALLVVQIFRDLPTQVVDKRAPFIIFCLISLHHLLSYD